MRLFAFLVLFGPAPVCSSWTNLTDEQLSAWYRYASPSVLSIVLNNTKCFYDGPVSLKNDDGNHERMNKTNQHLLATSPSMLLQHYMGCDLCNNQDLDGLYESKTTVPKAKIPTTVQWRTAHSEADRTSSFINFHRFAPLNTAIPSQVLVDTLLHIHRQNKTLVMMGDSVTRNMMSSLVCEVRRSLGAENVFVQTNITSQESLVTYTYTITTTSVNEEEKRQSDAIVTTSFDVYFLWYSRVVGIPSQDPTLKTLHSRPYTQDPTTIKSTLTTPIMPFQKPFNTSS